MSRWMSWRHRFVIFAAFLVAGFLGLGAVVTAHLQKKISQRLEKGWVLPPLELYSQGFLLAPGRKLPLTYLLEEIKKIGWQEDRDYVLGQNEGCAHSYGVELSKNAQGCLWIKSPTLLVTWDENLWIIDVWKGSPLIETQSFSLFPRLITQFFESQPILQQNTPLSEIPLACLQAVTAIEDRDFLEHKGVSASGILRAMVRNIRSGRFKEGGSTITQQLVKNFFLTPKKTLRRKIEEQLLAILLESQINKDQILEMYLNVIYMGQNGPYQVRGLGSASSYYFDKSIDRLNLAECALLAAIINSPGRYSPFDHQDLARSRRELVLNKMYTSSMIEENELKAANQAPLPIPSSAQKRVQAPYFVAAALKEFENLEIEADEGARLFTTLDADVQTLASTTLTNVLSEVEPRSQPSRSGPLQAALITIDLPSAQVLALVGGRDFKISQYNRVTSGRRQVGSIIKPFVYWPALRNHSPLTPVEDAPFEWRVGKQVWKPKNYDGKNRGTIPYFYALANSINTTAARVGQQVGLESVMLALNKSGVEPNAPRLPAITLGAVELSPFEVAQAFTTLANFGQHEQIHTLSRVEDAVGNVVYQRRPSKELALDPITTAVLVGMLRTTLDVGSARGARIRGLVGDYAGKTGTTSDTKDAWFVGFNSRVLTVVWVGYDDNTVMGLTGAGAALPIWSELQKQLQGIFQVQPFHWPEGVEIRQLSREELLKQFPNLKELPDQLELIFSAWAS